MSRDYRKLEVFREADSLVLTVYKMTTSMPMKERFLLQAQLRRAAVSAATNIVEGSARPSTGGYCRFLTIARGSARGFEYLIGLSKRLILIDPGGADEIARRYDRLRAGLMTLVRVLEHNEVTVARRPSIVALLQRSAPL